MWAEQHTRPSESRTHKERSMTLTLSHSLSRAPQAARHPPHYNTNPQPSTPNPSNPPTPTPTPTPIGATPATALCRPVAGVVCSCSRCLGLSLRPLSLTPPGTAPTLPPGGLSRRAITPTPPANEPPHPLPPAPTPRPGVCPNTCSGEVHITCVGGVWFCCWLVVSWGWVFVSLSGCLCGVPSVVLCRGSRLVFVCFDLAVLCVPRLLLASVRWFYAVRAWGIYPRFRVLSLRLARVGWSWPLWLVFSLAGGWLVCAGVAVVMFFPPRLVSTFCE